MIIDINNSNFIYLVFKDYVECINKINTFKYKFNDKPIEITTFLYYSKHKSWEEYRHPKFTYNQTIEIYNHIISELKEIAFNEIRNGVNDIVLTVQSLSDNKNYYKILHHSMVKYGYEFEATITIELL